MRRSLLACAFVPLCSLPAVADSDGWEVSTGADFSRGDYGTGQDTDILYIPLTATYKSGNLTFKGTLPWIRLDGGGVVGGGDSVIVVPGSAAADESGLGDVWLGAAYSLPNFPADIGFLDLTAKVKLPTADEDKGLGTGETDVTLQADFFKQMGDWTPLATLAYKIKGEPNGVSLDNVWYVSAGSAYRVSDDASVGATLDYQQASASGADDAVELFGYWAQRVAPAWRLTLYGYVGLSDGSPDFGVGTQLTYRQQQ